MPFRTILVSVAAAATCLIAGGCGLSSQYPLSNKNTSVPDERLLGKWEEQRTGGGDTWYVTKHPKFEKAMFLSNSPPQAESSRTLLFATDIDGRRYLSCEAYDPRRGNRCYFLCRYEMSDENTAHVWPLASDAIREAIIERRLSGEITISTTKGRIFGAVCQSTDVRITAEPKELREFLAKHGDSCFEDRTVFKRSK